MRPELTVGPPGPDSCHVASDGHVSDPASSGVTLPETDTVPLTGEVQAMTAGFVSDGCMTMRPAG